MKPYITDALKDGKYFLPFQIEGIPTDQFGKAFEKTLVLAYGVPKSQTLQAAWLFRLVLEGGWTVEFSSACTGVGGWQEMGSLNLAFAQEKLDADAIEWTMSPIENFRVLFVERLIFEDAEVYAENGIAFTDTTNREIVVVAGTAPGSVSIAIPASTDPLRSEFELERLRRQPL